jgi:hypothetical protein
MRFFGLVAASVVLASIAASPAVGLSFSDRGSEAFVTGRFDFGDEARFEEFLARPRPAPLRVVYLNSHGGNLQAGIEIGRLIRRARLATAVLATRDVCDSACTLAFAGGVRRHNVGGESVYEGMSSMLGLGFHPAHRRGNYVTPSMKTEDGTARIRAFYAEMGLPRAAELMDRAAINTLYRPSGRTTLELRIATSLAAP